MELAQKIFCACGFEKGSIEDIARGAGIAEGTIYRYFDSKRGLLDEVLRRHYSVLFDDIQQTLPSIEGHGNRLRYLIRRTLLTISGDRDMCRLRTLYARQLDDKHPSLSQDQNHRMAVLMANEIKEGMKSSSFRADASPSIVCDMIGGGLELIEYSYMRTGKAIDVDKVTESLASLVERLGHAADWLDPAWIFDQLIRVYRSLE